jgi:protein phosphatase-4 regulatory subunit 3
MVSNPSYVNFTGIWTSHSVAAAFRIFRLLLKQNNPNSHKIVKKHDILKPILDLTIQESLRDNLLSCSCQEYFEIMRKVS